MAEFGKRFLYEQLASELSKTIEQGIYAIHERFPSLRYSSELYGLSMATTIQAYQCLEQAGLIESRAKSGYYVCPWSDTQVQQPDLTQPDLTPTVVNVSQLAMSLLNEQRQPGLIKLGAAVPEPALQASGILSRTLSAVARRYSDAASSYEHAQGNIELRKQIVKLMRESGVRCTADDIIITNGCVEALGLALRVIAKKGDSIAIESPSYFGILQIIESLGMKVVEIASHASFGMEPAALEKAIKKRHITACVVMPTFHNPLGSSMPEQNKRKIVELLSRLHIPLIEDDVSGALSFASRRPKAAKAYDENDNVIYCSSFSKTVSPGLRIGWMLAARYQQQVLYQKFLTNISTAGHLQLTMAEFLSKGSYRRSVRNLAAVYQRRMDQLRRWIFELFPQGTRISNPQGGFLLWVELPDKVDSFDLYQRAMQKKIAITPGILFSAQGQYHHHLRLSCGAVEGQQARKSIRILASLL